MRSGYKGDHVNPLPTGDEAFSPKARRWLLWSVTIFFGLPISLVLLTLILYCLTSLVSVR